MFAGNVSTLKISESTSYLTLCNLGIEKENKFMYRFIQKLFKSKPKNSGERFNYGLKESAVEDIVYEVSEEDLANYTESCMYIR